MRAMGLSSIDFRPMILFEFQIVEGKDYIITCTHYVASQLKPWLQRRRDMYPFISPLKEVEKNVLPRFTPVYKPVPVTTTSSPARILANIECPTCKQLFTESTIYDHFQACLEMQSSIEIQVNSRYLRFGNLQVVNMDSNRPSTAFPDLKTLATQAVKNAVDSSTPPEDLARLFGYVQSISHRDLVNYVLQIMYPHISHLMKTKSLIKILGKQVTEILLITFISFKSRINVRVAAEILEFGIENELEDVKYVIFVYN